MGDGAAVDEAGTEAAAGTGAVMKAVSARRQVQFGADRPFLFQIVDRDGDVPLFMGRLAVPGE